MKKISDFVKPEGVELKRVRLCLVGGNSASALKACKIAMEMGLVEPVLVGDQAKITPVVEQLGMADGCEIVHVETVEDAAHKAVEFAKAGKVDILMKGQIGTGQFLKAIVSRKTGLPSRGLLSAVSMFEYDGRILFLTDAAINIYPTLDKKVDMLKNILSVARGLGVEQPKVAALAPMEKVNPAIKETVEADQLVALGQKGEFGDAVVEGPMALDLALSARSVENKGFESRIGGKADVLLAPCLGTANILHKSLALLTDSLHAAVVAGTSVPVIVNSRSENESTKFNSIAIASYLAANDAL